MTLTEIVQKVSDRTSITSAEGLTRITRSVQDRHRRVTASIGMEPRRVTLTQTTTPDDPDLTFALTKIELVFIGEGSQRRVLTQVLWDEWRRRQTMLSPSGLPWVYAEKNTTPGSITIALDPVPGVAVDISADGLAPLADLGVNDSPQFSADFHDVLVHGASADELRRKGEIVDAREEEAAYERRLSNLKMFLARSNTLSIVQGGRGRRARGSYWPAWNWGRW